MTASARIVNPQYLVETDWLAAHLADSELRVFDCTTYLDPDPVTVFVVRSGRPEWEQGHIPGAGYLALQGELSDAASSFRFTMPATQHRGEGGVHYGRPGRIAGSVNVPAHRLVDGESKVFLPAGDLAAMFAETGAAQAEKVITYCGGGIAASADAFVLALLGHDNIALYDGSLSEGGKDRTA